MNDETRAALVEELARATTTGTPYDLASREMKFAQEDWVKAFIMPIIDRLLAERHGATTVPDAERTYSIVDLMQEYQRGFRDCESLTAAAGPEADWLDGLTAIHPEAELNGVWFDRETKQFEATVRYPFESGWDGRAPYRKSSATASSPAAAIRNAIATALAAKQEGGER